MHKPLSAPPNDPTANTANNSGETPPAALALIPGALAFILYLVTCSPTINFTDSGELTTVAWTAGIAHPPGYPLYTLIGSAFIHLPFGNPAWRLNIVSAIFAAVAVGVFYALVTRTLIGMSAFERAVTRRSGRSRTPVAATSGKTSRAASSAQSTKQTGTGPKASGRKNRTNPAVSAHAATEDHDLLAWSSVAGGMAAAGLLAVSVTFWNWATQAKFYSLHFAFVAALLWLALSARRELITDIAAGAAAAPRWPLKAWPPATRLLHLLVFTVGLSFTNHFLTFLVLPGIVVLLLTPIHYARDLLRRINRHAGTLILAGLIPLLIYLYLPVRAAANPLIEWGTPDNWGDFIRQVTARSYQDLFGSGDFGSHFADALIYAANQFGPWLGLLVLVLAAAGIVYLWRTDRGLLAATALTAIFTVIVDLNYGIREIVTYYVPFYMIMLWWAGLGVAQGIHWVQRWLSSDPATSEQTSDSTRARSRTATIAITLALGAALPLIGLMANWSEAGHRDNYAAELYARNAFKNFRPDALVLTNYWDLTSLSFYLQHVLNERRDVVVIDKGMLRQPFYLDYLERTYPDLISRIAEPFAAYKGLLRQWVNTGQTPRDLPDAYIRVLNGLIDTNLGQRPVYVNFIAAGNDVQERQEIQAILTGRENRLVPDGIANRIATGEDDLRTQNPQFDLRGITNNRVPFDEIEAATIALYPPTLQSIGNYMQSSTAPEDKDVGARLLALADQLQPFAPLRDARPRLR